MAPTPTILISDDEPHIVSALERQARGVGLSYISDTTSKRVCELARLHKPDVILLDVEQNIDGRDLLAALKKDPATRDLTVVMLSSSNDQATRMTCLALGAHEYALKPFDVTFIRRIARLAGTPGRSSSPGPRNALNLLDQRSFS